MDSLVSIQEVIKASLSINPPSFSLSSPSLSSPSLPSSSESIRLDLEPSILPTNPLYTLNFRHPNSEAISHSPLQTSITVNETHNTQLLSESLVSALTLLPPPPPLDSLYAPQSPVSIDLYDDMEPITLLYPQPNELHPPAPPNPTFPSLSHSQTQPSASLPTASPTPTLPAASGPLRHANSTPTFKTEVHQLIHTLQLALQWVEFKRRCPRLETCAIQYVRFCLVRPEPGFKKLLREFRRVGTRTKCTCGHV